MRWTVGLLLLATAGCGYRQTKMVACPAPGCADSYASSSPEGTRHTPLRVQPTVNDESMAPAPPIEPAPATMPPADTMPPAEPMPPPEAPVPSP